ncbi:PREDICTED: methyltransferase-like protein 13 isoform X2 [Ipomoea nil]|uniref:methyltransferase-like protein 13 isoform X2 n=1 Tax=Ipomoea nil TaxID=35883 RepID=UPI0009012B92|nr:PREDICTED: methyltransferase-like protein 13 isoform X2 [Ipomoea nil]
MTLGGGGTTQVAYGDKWYWEKRYAQEPVPYDWYQTYHSLAPLLRLYVHPHHRVLVVGCGNSAFSEGMIDDGYADVVNVDSSSVVIEAMRKKYSNRPQLKYMNMDVRDMSAFEAGSFDAIIDKGVFLQCGNGSTINAAQMLAEVCRVLKDEGKYVLITYGAPVQRLPLLRNSCSLTIKLHVIDKVPTGSSHQQKWELTSPIALDKDVSSVESVLGPNPSVHYIYVCVKDNTLESRHKAQIKN